MRNRKAGMADVASRRICAECSALCWVRRHTHAAGGGEQRRDGGSGSGCGGRHRLRPPSQRAARGQEAMHGSSGPRVARVQSRDRQNADVGCGCGDRRRQQGEQRLVSGHPAEAAARSASHRRIVTGEQFHASNEALFDSPGAAHRCSSCHRSARRPAAKGERSGRGSERTVGLTLQSERRWRCR